MNLLPLAALLIACLALAVSVVTLITAHRRPRRQTQVGGDGSTQLQSGGTLHIPASISTTGEEVTINLPARNGRHL